MNLSCYILQGKKTEIIISKLMMSMPSTGSLPERLEIFSRQLMMLQSISYEPMSMCTLNRSLITSVSKFDLKMNVNASMLKRRCIRRLGTPFGCETSRSIPIFVCKPLSLIIKLINCCVF